MNRLWKIIALLACVAGFLSWRYSPKQVVKRRTYQLLETLTLDDGQGRAARQMGVYSINALLAPTVEIEIPEQAEANGFFDRSEVESAYGWLCEHAEVMRFEPNAVERLAIDGDHAVIDVSVKVRVEMRSHSLANGDHTMRFGWAHRGDVWQLERASWRKNQSADMAPDAPKDDGGQ